MTHPESVSEYKRLLKEDRNNALPFFLEHLVDYASEEYEKKIEQLRKKGQWREDYCCVISLLGFSPEPVIQLIRAVKPEKVYVITTEGSAELLDTVFEHSGIRLKDFRTKQVDSDESESVYEKIKEIKNELPENEFRRTVVDITGGKKSMVSSATLAANYLNLDVVYTDFKSYRIQEGRPEPFAEFPVLLKDPLEIFGDEEKKKAIERFNAQDFKRAAEIFRGIKERVMDPVEFEVREQISLSYHALSKMKFSEAKVFMSTALQKGRKLESIRPMDEKLTEQLALIEGLVDFQDHRPEDILKNDDLFWRIHGYIFAQAKGHFLQEKYDHTALFTYRCLEMMMQYRLLHHGIDASDAHLETRVDFDVIRQSVNQQGQILFGEKTFRLFDTFGNKIPLVTGLMVLKALGDTHTKQLCLRRVKDYVNARNNSIFAHGFQEANKEDVEPFLNMVMKGFSSIVWKHQLQDGVLSDKLQHYRRFEEMIEAFDYAKMV